MGAYWVVQKYIEKPMCYRNRKFDLRIWALVTDSFTIYIYKEGYIRTCSTDFDINASNNMVHLTN